jgi:hypothetical protein
MGILEFLEARPIELGVLARLELQFGRTRGTGKKGGRCDRHQENSLHVIYLPSHNGRASPVSQFESQIIQSALTQSHHIEWESESSIIQELPQMVATLR